MPTRYLVQEESVVYDAARVWLLFILTSSCLCWPSRNAPVMMTIVLLGKPPGNRTSKKRSAGLHDVPRHSSVSCVWSLQYTYNSSANLVTKACTDFCSSITNILLTDGEKNLISETKQHQIQTAMICLSCLKSMETKSLLEHSVVSYSDNPSTIADAEG